MTVHAGSVNPDKLSRLVVRPELVATVSAKESESINRIHPRPVPSCPPGATNRAAPSVFACSSNGDLTAHPARIRLDCAAEPRLPNPEAR